MKKIWLLFVSMIVLFSSGCSKNPLGSPGTLSFYSGKTGNSSQAPALKATAVYAPEAMGPVDEFYVYIKSIDVSTNGEKWTNVFTGFAEVKVTPSGTIKIGSTIDLPEDEYHGIRVTIEPKVKMLYGGNEIIVEKLPFIVVLVGGSKITTPIYNPSDTISITSANGHLIPFTIKRGKETFIVFDMFCTARGSNISTITDWDLYISVWATKYLS